MMRIRIKMLCVGNYDEAPRHALTQQEPALLADVELWKDADPELQPVVRDVRARLARLMEEH